MPVEQAVILCGGRGTRLADRAGDQPKPMIPLAGRPVLDHIIETLAAAGIRRVLLAAGHRGEVIARHYAGGRASGCAIEVLIESAPRGTAGALRGCADRLEEDFVVAYGDVFLDCSLRGLLAAHAAQRPLGTLLVRASDHPWDSDLVVTDGAGRVVEFVHRREPGRRYRNLANAGVYVLSRRVLELIPADRPADFGAEVFPAALAGGEILGSQVLAEEAFVQDMGTPERLAAVEEYLADRALAAAARADPQPLAAVLLDRDGVLTADAGLVDRPEKLALLPGAVEALALLRQGGIRCVVTTNQPVVARGLCTPAGLEAIHDRLRAEVAAGGGALEAIYYCPHPPETHHGEGVPELRRACRCRKPAPGLLFRARRELGLDLRACVLVGDRAADVRAGRAAGVRTVLVGDGAARAAARAAAPPDAEFDSLLAFARGATEAGWVRR